MYEIYKKSTTEEYALILWLVAEREDAMSNLGGYETAVKTIKRLGGPKNAIGWGVVGVLLVGIALTLRPTVEKGFKKGKAWISSKRENKEVQYLAEGRVFTISSENADVEGVNLVHGDTYRVLGRDENAVIIEKLGDNNNPYVVSAEVLKEISDFDLD